MSTLYETIMQLCEEKGIKGGKMCTDLSISKGLLSDLKFGRRTGVSAKTANKIASYFGVSVGYLLGEESDADGMEDENMENRTPTDDEIMFALFDGDKPITPEMYEEVKRFARYVQDRDNTKKDE